MAGVDRAEKAFQDIISDFKNHRTAKLTVFTERGMLKVIREDNFFLTDRCPPPPPRAARPWPAGAATREESPPACCAGRRRGPPARP
jgi:hypothetical protein